MSDYTQKNIEHFDKRAATYDASVFKTGLQTKAVNAILSTQDVKWDPNSTVVVDFACGTGSPHNFLKPGVSDTVRADFGGSRFSCPSRHWVGYQSSDV